MIMFIKRNSYQLFVLGLIILVVFMHTYKLAEIPYGLNVDEASAAYDAFCIANFGVDRWLDPYPVYFTNYGDGQNALYIYLLVAIFKVFGISKNSIRALITLSAFLAVFFGYKYCKLSWKERKVSWIYLGLYAILPVFTMTQRFGLESHLMLAAAVAIVYFVAKAFETGKIRDAVIAGCVCGISLYTYALSYVVMPIFLLLVFIYGLRLRRIRVGNSVALVAPLLFFAIPLIIVQLVNVLDLPTLIIGPFSFPRFINYRSDEVSVSSLLHLGSRFKAILFNTFCYDDCSYNSSGTFGVMYYISIPFIAIGIVNGILNCVKAFKERLMHYDVFMMAWLLGMLVMGLTIAETTVPNNTRMIGIFGVLLYFLVGGLICIYDWTRKKSERVSRGYAVCTVISYLICFSIFVTFYFNDYNEKGYPFKWLFYEPYYEVKEYISENANEDYVYRSTCYPWNYIYYCLTYEVNPYEFNLPDNGKEMYGRDFINGFPKEIHLERNYVVYHTDKDSGRILSELGYHCDQLEKFGYYISPFEYYEQKNNTEFNTYIDEIRKIKDQVRISGWSVDEVSQAAFAEIYVEVDGNRCNAEIIAREDVAALYQNENCIHSGFEVNISRETFATGSYILLKGIDVNGAEHILYEWNERA